MSLQDRRAEELASLQRQKKLEDILRQKREKEAAEQSELINDQEMVDTIFGFLPNMVGGQEGQAPSGFEVRSKYFRLNCNYVTVHLSRISPFLFTVLC